MRNTNVYPACLYASEAAAAFIRCAVADFPAPAGAMPCMTISSNALPVKMNDFGDEVGNFSKPWIASRAAAKTLVVLTLRTSWYSSGVIEKGFSPRTEWLAVML